MSEGVHETPGPLPHFAEDFAADFAERLQQPERYRATSVAWAWRLPSRRPKPERVPRPPPPDGMSDLHHLVKNSLEARSNGIVACAYGVYPALIALEASPNDAHDDRPAR